MMKSAFVNLYEQTDGEALRRCDCPGCREEGRFRAPVSRNQLDSHHWFCLEHVRAYNTAWDYYGGMNEVEIEMHRREDAVWRRPSWPFGSSEGWKSDAAFRDDFGHFGAGLGGDPARRQPVNDRERALEVLGLGFEASFAEAKVRYRELVKRLHPDANGGDRDAEERLKGINQAYTVLKASSAQ
jgi:hypothetical protein